MTSDDRTPQVSVGIPTYNRPGGLRRTLECILGQTHRNLDVIITDNCSPDPEVERVAREFVEKDHRVRYFRQEKNQGSVPNFIFALRQASGPFFMWAADDDEWEPVFIEKLLEPLLTDGRDYAASVSEARYVVNEQRCPLVPEGKALYGYYAEDKLTRLKYMLDHSYGNLFYSIFRTEAIEDIDLEYYVGRQSYFNEIPLILHVAQSGNWHVSPEVYWYKCTSQVIFDQVLWEEGEGQQRRPSIGKMLRKIVWTVQYHAIAIRGIWTEVDMLSLENREKRSLKWKVLTKLNVHMVSVVTGLHRSPRSESK
jgi:glycosyltransferase involved in cell wall biosynthesis